MTDTIQSGLIPVLHGDAVLDVVKGCSILSGDTIIQTICETHDVDRVVFLTSVAGIYDRPPDADRDAALLQNITVTTEGKIKSCTKQQTTQYSAGEQTRTGDAFASATDDTNTRVQSSETQTSPKGDATSDSTKPALDDDNCSIKMDTSSHDVTGGMSNKLNSALKMVVSSKGRTKVFICKVGSDYASSICLDGATDALNAMEGTCIELGD